MKKISRILLAVALVLSFSAVMAVPVAAADTWYVDPTGTDDGSHGTGTGSDAFATIQYAIDQASADDTINVAAGTYPEHITLKDGVELLGAGAGSSIIDGTSSGTVVTANGVGSTTKLDGFTIANGSADEGGGMYNENNSSPTVSNCTFSGNEATSLGGGMSNYDNSSPTVTNCTFSGNEATSLGGGMCNHHNSSPTVTNCILWGDSPQEIYNISSTPAVTYCDVQGGYGGTGNIDADPMFVNPAAGDFHLQAGSPCIDAGDNGAPSLPSTDFEGDPRIVDGDDDTVATVDMGADEYVIPPPVGGELYPVDKLSILAPWLTLALLLALGGGFVIMRRRLAC